MRIGEIDIPVAEIEKLSGTKQRILHLLYQAHPNPVGIGDLLRAGGTGCQTRRKKLNENFLAGYGLAIEGRPAGVNENGTQIWEYAIWHTQPRIDEKGNYTLPLPVKPEKTGLTRKIGVL